MEQQIQTQNGIKSPVLKCTTAIGAAGGANSGIAAEAKAHLLEQASQYPDWFASLMSLPWGSIASMAAAVYTCALLGEWVWKKLVFPSLIHIGLMEKEHRLTQEEWDALYRKRK